MLAAGNLAAGNKVQRENRGIVLLLVLVVVAMLALGGYSFVRLMMAESKAARFHGIRVKARSAANSGVDYLVALIEDRRRRGIWSESLYDNPLRFRNIPVSASSAARNRTAFQFSVISDGVDGDHSRSGDIRFGLSDEAARLNLNSWPWVVHLLQDPETELPLTDRNPLIAFPGMTPEIADAILDWIDPDNEPRPNGAEEGYYLSMRPSYRPRNGPMQSAHELLMVRGVTPRLLYGEDANQNGVLDPNENDGARSYPDDNQDGILDRGWLALFSLQSELVDNDRVGRPKILVDSSDLKTLFDQLAGDPDLGEEVARFVLAYRVFGPIPETDEIEAERPQETTPEDASPVEEVEAFPETETNQSPQLVGGIDISKGPIHQIQTPADIIDARVAAIVDGRPTELTSPITIQAATVDLDHWLDRTATIATSELRGRINVNTAPREVLMAVPLMTGDMVEAILDSRSRRRSADPFHDGIAWILNQNVVSLDDFKRIEPYVIGNSRLYRMQVLGYSQDGIAVSRIRCIIDASGPTPVVVSKRDLTDLGHGVMLRIMQ